MLSVYDDVARSLTAGPERDGETVRAEFVFRDTFAGFEGHFPGNPIVPGIAQIYAAQITLEIAEMAVGGSGRKIRLQETARCKFMRPVLPNEVVRVSLAGSWDNGTMRCKADITANGEPCSSMILVWESVQ